MDANVRYVLEACRDFVSDEVYERHFTCLTSRNEAQVLKCFFENLAKLDSEHQDDCFEAIVKMHKDMNEEGSVHVVKRLQEGTERDTKIVCLSKSDITKKGDGLRSRVGGTWKMGTKPILNLKPFC